MSWQRRVSGERGICLNSVSADLNPFETVAPVFLQTTLPLALPAMSGKKEVRVGRVCLEEVIVMSTSRRYTISCCATV